MIRGRITLPMNTRAIMNVMTNSIFSDPLLFTLPVSDTSPPPKALPTFASPRWSSTAIMRRIALAT